MATAELVKQLREETGVSVMQCKKALEEAGDDIEKAREILKQKGAEIAAKKADRAFGAGAIGSYIHMDHSIGVLVELLCETDFVSRNEEFRQVADDIAMHIAAMSPEYIRSEDISDEDREQVRSLYEKEVAAMDKPEEVKEKVLEGKVSAHFKERTLMEQPFVKDQNMTITQLLEQTTQKFGENTAISRFTRYALLES